MKWKSFSSLVLFASFAIFSCQKQISLEDEPTGGGNSQIIGDYDLVDFRVMATSTATAEAAPGELYISRTDYTTKNNQGTAKITPTTISTTNISYSIDTTIKGYFYSGGFLVDSVETPFVLTMPPSSSVSAYTVAGADSIRIEAGMLDSPLGSGVTPPAEPAGVKYSWSGNILTMKTNFTITSAQDIGGETINILYEGIQWIRLKKK